MAEQSPVINLAFTGASGAQYGLRLLQCLVANGCRVNVMISKAAQVVIATETDFRLPGSTPAMAEALSDFAGAQPGQVQVFGREEWFSPPASGSGEKAPLVICPCSTGTLSALATGASNNLIERAGDVARTVFFGNDLPARIYGACKNRRAHSQSLGVQSRSQLRYSADDSLSAFVGGNSGLVVVCSNESMHWFTMFEIRYCSYCFYCIT